MSGFVGWLVGWNFIINVDFIGLQEYKGYFIWKLKDIVCRARFTSDYVRWMFLWHFSKSFTIRVPNACLNFIDSRKLEYWTLWTRTLLTAQSKKTTLVVIDNWQATLKIESLIENQIQIKFFSFWLSTVICRWKPKSIFQLSNGD